MEDASPFSQVPVRLHIICTNSPHHFHERSITVAHLNGILITSRAEPRCSAKRFRSCEKGESLWRIIGPSMRGSLSGSHRFSNPGDRFLVLLMHIPTGMIQGVIGERQATRRRGSGRGDRQMGTKPKCHRAIDHGSLREEVDGAKQGRRNQDSLRDHIRDIPSRNLHSSGKIDSEVAVPRHFQDPVYRMTLSVSVSAKPDCHSGKSRRKTFCGIAPIFQWASRTSGPLPTTRSLSGMTRKWISCQVSGEASPRIREFTLI